MADERVPTPEPQADGWHKGWNFAKFSNFHPPTPASGREHRANLKICAKTLRVYGEKCGLIFLQCALWYRTTQRVVLRLQRGGNTTL